MLGDMDPRLDLLTLGVQDLAVARDFYVEGLGWAPVLEVPGEVVFVQVAFGQLLSLYDASALARDTGDVEPSTPPRSVTLGHVVQVEADVDRVVERFVRAGGSVVAAGRHLDWGGYVAFVADPDGYRWEIAHNPGFRVGVDGTVSIGPVAPDVP